MESDFETNDTFTLSQDPFDANDNDNLDAEGERCGICMDMVIDRGVLDCCQHWFCFVCIDNWATITNLCPLCQNEFQLITCVPVYDTIGSNKVEDGSFFRDDDWSIDGKNNSLSFPSYYIDENAVTCLDGDGCKIRNGLASIEEDSGLDTSIACDSCDLWYHAFCVGFDTEGTSESTWLCPRCEVDEVSKETDTSSIKEATLECNPDNNNSECHAEDSFSGIVSVSIADTGETAVVVSMVDRNKWVPETNERGLCPPEVDGDRLTESCSLMSDTNNQPQAAEKTTLSPIMKVEELELSLSHSTSKSSMHNDLKKIDNGTRCELSSFDGTKLFDESHAKTSPCKTESDMGLHLGLSVGSFITVNDVDTSKTKDQATDALCSSPEVFPLKGDEMEINACEDSDRVAGRKRKHFDYSHEQVHTKADDEDAKPELLVEASQKKIRAADSQIISANDSADAQLSDNAKKSPAIKRSPTKEIAASDIMNIVKGTNRRLSKGLADTNASEKLAEKKGNMAGLRVKKIMKRVSDDGESSSVVQNLRKEIREAVRNKSSISFEDNRFDKNLLEAFRAAITGPKTELVNKLSPTALKAKKSMLQKGKVRENLTRKIFATSNGRRKRAWDRDCEIEFWKYRCMRASKPEKVETLQSVLDLLRKSSENPESEQTPSCQAKNPILSRLYIADTSVFPRKQDVKPFSEQTKLNNPSAKGTNQSVDNKTIKATEVNYLLSKTRVCSSEKKVDKKIVRGPVGKVHSSSHSEGTSVSSSASANVGTKESGLKSDSVKGDKRKWALEVLARKTAVGSKSTSNESQEEDAIFKGNYPLLAQLPTNMRPVLAPCRHNKIPVSVRQAQLYRLTERLLKNANLPIIRRTADTELAVADAINIEKEVADRSNSKPVYLNLCSQELLHRTNNKKSNADTDKTPPTSSPVHTDQPELNTDDMSTDPDVQIALKNAGLLSDSPPSSPYKDNEICNENEVSGPKDILELDSNPELDIYGDFEYDLEDDDYICASVTKVPNLKQEQSEPKVKLVFSTTSLKKTNNDLDCADCKGSENNEVPGDTSCSPDCQSDVVHRDSTNDAEIGHPSVSSGLLPCEDSVDPADSEFEELYGPDKEPLIKKFPDGELRSVHGEGKTEFQSENNNFHKDEEHVLDKAVNGAELGNDKSSNISGTNENIQRKKEKSDIPAQQSNNENPIAKKVEAYIKEHIRPLCKSGVITAEQYRWAVAKTTEKVMKYHCKSKNANFLIKEGEKVKKLAEQYVEAAQENRKN
ncbi:uncharacterized protein At4g10930 isoform X1 [Lathyrus oleraceus]|uniref:RING/U-box protein n=1 Tax=Pisum sativum TaxID=3888 RepID=A0A9D4VGE1_PEA|nr:uncharacterized protein At4g10930 isoform X1 [Pisum sativum]KAI5383414.1 hypothetical protein KIW84_070711 [Pisum sativum]